MYESHTSCLRKGLEARAKNIVVFEDDVVFDRFDAECFRQSTQFLTAHPDWKVLLLGAMINKSGRTASPCIHKVGIIAAHVIFLLTHLVILSLR